jgi:excisionase family DNA binding protein
MDDYLSQSQAAKILGLSRQRVGQLVKAGRIEHVTVGGHIVTTRAAVKEYQRNRKKVHLTG